MRDLRAFVHVGSVAVWVGGQIVLMALVAALRPLHRDALPVVARAFGRVAWPAFGLAVASGLWWLLDVEVSEAGTDYQIALGLKLLLVAASGTGAAIHSVSASRAAKGAGAAVGLLAAIAALWAGVSLG